MSEETPRATPPVNLVGAARGGTQEDLRRHNLTTVLALLHQRGSLTRAQLTELIELNRSTVGGLVAELSALGLVSEQRPAGTKIGAGRPSLMVVPNTESVQVLVVDIGVDRVVAARVGLTGRITARRRHRLGRSRSAARLVKVITQLYADLHAQEPSVRVVGIAVSIPGVVRREDGLVRLAPNLRWVDEPFGDLLRAAFPGVPLWWGNDADLGLLGEHRRGAARAVRDAVFLAGEIGVGGAIIVAGRSLTGAGGYAGEFGHMLIRPGGRRCRCGANGCWETEIGARAICRALGVPQHTSSEDLIAVLSDADQRTAALLYGVGEYLGRGLSILVNTVNPQLIVVGGILAHAYPLIEDVVREQLDRQALAAPREQVAVTVPQLGDDAALIGAAELAWEQLLVDPVGMLGPRGDAAAFEQESGGPTLGEAVAG